MAELVAQIDALAKLHTAGALTDDEFAKAKAKLLEPGAAKTEAGDVVNQKTHRCQTCVHPFGVHPSEEQSIPGVKPPGDARADPLSGWKVGTGANIETGNPKELFADFIREQPTHPFSRLILDDRVSEEKKITAACAGRCYGPESWQRLIEVTADDVPKSLDGFRRLMKTDFVLAKVDSLMQAVGVEYERSDVPLAVEAFLNAAYRGFCWEWSAQDYFFGITLSVDCVLVCDDAKKLTTVTKGGVEQVAGQRLLTLLHEFAHFFPRFVTANHPAEEYPGTVDQPRKFRTPEKPQVQINDIPNDAWRPEAGEMFERMLIGRAVKSHVTLDAAKQLLSWNGSTQLSLAPSSLSLVSVSSGAAATSTRPVVEFISDQQAQRQKKSDKGGCCSTM
jgi:hypothetical protein